MKQKAKNSFDFLTISRSVAILTAVSNKIKTRGHVLFKDFGNSLKAGLVPSTNPWYGIFPTHQRD